MADISNFDNISKLQTYEDYIANNITEWEAESVARVCRKIGKIGRMSKKELEKFDADKEAKKEWERIVAALAIATALNIRTLKKAYISEFEAWEKQSDHLYQYRGKKPLGVKNEALQGVIEKAVKQNGKDILNLTNTKALSVLDRNGNPIRFRDAIYKSFGDAVKTVTEGKADFYTTMRQTVQNLGGGGCRVNYGEGITRRLDTVVRQNMLYGIKQANGEYNERIGEEIGATGYEIDYHSNSRPTHRFMQGRQFCIGESKTINGKHFDGMEDTRDAESGKNVTESLQDYGCRHYKTAIICGVSEPRYSAEELKQLKEQDEKIYKVGNLEGDGYYFSQKLRNIEAEVRKMKDEINALKSFGNSANEIKELKSKINTYRKKYNEISEITGIQGDKKRMWVGKGGNPKDLAGVKIKPPKENAVGRDGKLFKVDSPPKLSFEVPQKPKRPSRKDYVDENKYLADKMKYREAIDKYEENIDRIVDEQSNRKIKFKTKSDFEVWAKNKGIYYESDVFEKIDGVALEDFAEVTDEMFEKYPFLSGETYSVSGETFKSKFRLSAKPSIDGCFMEANSGVAFNPNYFGDYKKALREALGQMSDGSLVVGDGTLKTAIRHEFGHNVEAHIRLAHSSKEMVVFERELIDLVKTKGVSEYASTNSCELFAEGFAAFESGEKTEFAEAFGKLIERWLK